MNQVLTAINVKFIFLILICALMSCNVIKQQSVNSTDKLVLELNKEIEYLNNLKSKIKSQIKDKNDTKTPYRILVEESEASKFKERIKSIYDNNPNRLEKLESLKTIIDGCKNQEVKWDEYCFKEMPWFGVEPILNVWIISIEESVKNIE
jgi:hypothetical protein